MSSPVERLDCETDLTAQLFLPAWVTRAVGAHFAHFAYSLVVAQPCQGLWGES